MAEPRELRGLVAAEIAAVLVLAVVPLPDMVPVALPLLVAGTLSRWVRGRSWADVTCPSSQHLAIGALAGVAALVIAVVIGTPFVEAASHRAIEWSAVPVVRGNVAVMIAMIVHAAVTALAFELALRGWVVERVLELSPGPPILPVLVGAFAEAIVTPGDVAARSGALLFGIGLGWLYVAGGRCVLAPAAARVAFAMLAVVLEALRVVG